MGTTGSGTGTPLASSASVGPTYDSCALPLHRYAEMIGYSENAFFGIAHPDNDNFSCRMLWTQEQRDDAARYLCLAADMIAREVGYPLVPTFITGEQHPVISRKQQVYLATHTNWHKLLQFGYPVSTLLMEDAPVVIGDLCTVSFPVTLTSTDGIIVYYPNTATQIHPDALTYIGGTLTITVPKSRMVKFSLRDNDESGIDYFDDNNFQATVDVLQVTANPGQSGELIWPSGNTCTTSSEVRRTVKVDILNAESGFVKFNPATYASGVWTLVATDFSIPPSMVQFNYQAGLTRLTSEIEMMIVRLAHSLMPQEPCGCEVMQRLWARDHNIPAYLSVRRLECPFGITDGAWTAWKYTQNIKKWSVGVL